MTGAETLQVVTSEVPRLAPLVMNLLPEILSHIFEWAHRVELKQTNPESPQNCLVPVHISHVSQHFRNVALKTPSLWASIYVRHLSDLQADYIESCINRSGIAFPLDIHLVFNNRLEAHPSIRDSVFSRVMTLIQTNTYRLKLFSVVCVSRESLHYATKFMDKPAPLLTNLKLEWKVGHAEEGVVPFVPFGNQMNQLADLYLDHMPVLWSKCAFSNLTTLYLRDLTGVNFTYQDFWSLIQNSPSLRRLHIHFLEGHTISRPTMLHDIHNPVISLDSLDSLHLAFLTINDLLELITRIRAPHLRSLTLEFLMNGDISRFMNKLFGPPVLFPELTSFYLLTESERVLIAGPRLRRAYPTFQWKRDNSLGTSYTLTGVRKSDDVI